MSAWWKKKKKIAVQNDESFESNSTWVINIFEQKPGCLPLSVPFSYLFASVRFKAQ